MHSFTKILPRRQRLGGNVSGVALLLVGKKLPDFKQRLLRLRHAARLQAFNGKHGAFLNSISVLKIWMVQVK
jgi:hypothetical protein